MSAARLIFDLAGAAALLFAVIMVAHPNPVKSLLALVVSFFSLAVTFALLSAPFLAAIQVIVYAGAILVLFLFVIMLLNLDREQKSEDRRPIQQILSIAGILVFAVVLFLAIGVSGNQTGASGEPASAGDVAALAKTLFSRAALPFEAVGILLLAALTGASLLTRRSPR
jgi:NADH-quinone oxidoreductase subunit J